MSFADALDVLYEDNHCVAVNKPAGWPTTHFDGVDETVDRLVKSYLKEKYAKPGNVFLGVVHRLDKPVTGVLLFARTSKAAARFSEQFRDGGVDKVYWAVIETADEFREAGTLEDWLFEDKTTGRVSVCPPNHADAKHAVLHYHRRAVHGELTLVELRPQTGRRHQLRVQLASRGWPIYGDVKYGSRHSFGPGIGLHARTLSVLHPTRGEPLELTAEVPKAWRGRFAYLLKPS